MIQFLEQEKTKPGLLYSCTSSLKFLTGEQDFVKKYGWLGSIKEAQKDCIRCCMSYALVTLT